MRLMYAFPADAAQFTSDGKLWVLGGDFDTVYASSFPTVRPTLAFVVKISVDPTETRLAHTIRLDLHDGDGESMVPSATLRFTPPLNQERPHDPVNAVTVFNIAQIPFARPGEHIFRIWVDDTELGSVSLHVVRRAEDES